MASFQTHSFLQHLSALFSCLEAGYARSILIHSLCPSGERRRLRISPTNERAALRRSVSASVSATFAILSDRSFAVALRKGD